MDKVLEDDPTAYEYDAVYDKMAERKANLLAAKTAKADKKVCQGDPNFNFDIKGYQPNYNMNKLNWRVYFCSTYVEFFWEDGYECARWKTRFILTWHCREQRKLRCLERDSNSHLRVSSKTAALPIELSSQLRLNEMEYALPTQHKISVGRNRCVRQSNLIRYRTNPVPLETASVLVLSTWMTDTFWWMEILRCVRNAYFMSSWVVGSPSFFINSFPLGTARSLYGWKVSKKSLSL